MALLPFLRDASLGASEHWAAAERGAGALRNEADHMPTDAELSPLVRMGTRLNRDALRAFLNDDVEALADEVKREMSDGREDALGGGGGERKSSAEAMVEGLLKQSKQNAATLNFGRVPFPEGDTDAEVLRSKRGAASKVTAMEGSKQRKWAKKFGEQLGEMSKKVEGERSALRREAEQAEEAGFEVAAASQAAWNEVMRGARKVGKGTSAGMDAGVLDAHLERVKATEVRTSVVMDEAMEAEEVIRQRPTKQKTPRAQHKYQSDVWETVDEDEAEEESAQGVAGSSSSSSSSQQKKAHEKKAATERPRARSEPQPAWLKAEGNAGEARIVYASDKAGGQGVDAEEVAAREARMDASIKSRFQGLLGSIMGKKQQLDDTRHAAEEEKQKLDVEIMAAEASGKAELAAALEAQREKEARLAEAAKKPLPQKLAERKSILAPWMRADRVESTTIDPAKMMKSSSTADGKDKAASASYLRIRGEVDKAVARERQAEGSARAASDMLSVDPTDAVRWAALEGARAGTFGAAQWSEGQCSSEAVLQGLKKDAASNGEGLGKRDLRYLERLWKLLDESRGEVPTVRKVREPHVMPVVDPSVAAGGGAGGEMSAVERLKAAIARGKQRASDEEGTREGEGDPEESVEVLDDLPENDEVGGGGGSAAERRRRKRRGKSRADGDEDGESAGGEIDIEALLSKGGLDLDTDELIDLGIVKDEHRGVDDNDRAAAVRAEAEEAAKEATTAAAEARVSAVSDVLTMSEFDASADTSAVDTADTRINAFVADSVAGDDPAGRLGSGSEEEAAASDAADLDAAARDAEEEEEGATTVTEAEEAAEADASGQENDIEGGDGEGDATEEAEDEAGRRRRRAGRRLLNEPPNSDIADVPSSSSGDDSSGGDDGEDPLTAAIPLTLHRRMFFPNDYFNNNGYCPKISKTQRQEGCDEARRRLPRAFELKDEIFVKGIAQHLTGGSNSGGGDETITVDPRDTLRLKFKMDMLGALPLEDVALKFETCAVVGNSGSVEGAGQGPEIDAAEAVFRINYAPTKGFEKDVGSKTHFDVINLQHTKPFVQGRVRTGGTQPEALRGELRNSSIVLFEVLSPVARYHLYAPLLKRAQTQLEKGWVDNAKTPATRPLILSPDLIAHAHRLWFKMKSSVELATIVAGYRPTKFNSKPMSGWFAVVLAMHSCKKVKLYGFSPYKGRRAGLGGDAATKYHYFDNVVGVTMHHSFDFAFEAYRQLSNWPCGGVDVTMRS